MEVAKELNGKALVVHVKGEVDTTTAPDLDKEVSEDIAKVDDLALDFENVNYVSSAGLRVILSLYKRMNDKGGAFALRNVNSEVMTVLEMTGFTTFLTIK